MDFLENELSQFSKEGVTLADSVETLGVDSRTRVKRLGAKEKARRKKCKVRFSIIKKNEAFQKSYMKVCARKLLRAAWCQQELGEYMQSVCFLKKSEIEEVDGSSSRQN